MQNPPTDPRGPSARPQRALPLLLLTLLAATVVLPLFLAPHGIRSGDAYRDNDWLSIVFFSAWLQHAVHELGQFPLWCPYVGGGYPTVLHPSDASLTPLAAPVLLFGHVLGLKIDLALLLLAGGLGVYLLAREHLGLGPWAALFSAAAYVASGWFPSRMLVGFLNLAMLQLVPLALWLLLRGTVRLRSAIPAGLLLGWLAHMGGMATLTTAGFAALLIAAITGAAWWRERRTAWRPAAALAVAGIVGAGVAWVKIDGVRTLLARGQYAHAAERASMDYAAFADAGWSDHFYDGVGGLLGALGRAVPLEATYGADGWPATLEYAQLGIPWPALLLFPLGAWWLGRRYLPWLIAGGVFTALCLGPSSPVDLYRWLVWPFEPLRAISQFYKYANYFVLLVIALGAGAALDGVARRWPRAGRPFAALALAGLVPFAFVHGARFGQLCRVDAPPWTADEGFAQVRASHNPAPELGRTVYRERARVPGLVEYDNLLAGVGTVDWYGDLYLPEHAVPRWLVDPVDGTRRDNPAYRGEVEVAEGRATVRGWSIAANTISVDVVVDEPPVTLVVNQNFDVDWGADHGGTMGHDDGRLAVRLERAGPVALRLRYVPARFLRDLAVSALWLSGSLAIWGWSAWRGGTRRRARPPGKESR